MEGGSSGLEKTCEKGNSLMHFQQCHYELHLSNIHRMGLQLANPMELQSRLNS